MAKAASLVLATVNAPYGANLSAHQLAALIADPGHPAAEALVAVPRAQAAAIAALAGSGA